MTIQQLIEAKLTAALSPTVLEVINESHMHRVEPGSESHFKVVIVSEQFAGQRLLARHRQVNAVLADELAGAVHALALAYLHRDRVAGKRPCPAHPELRWQTVAVLKPVVPQDSPREPANKN